jgi:hypothetical protein
LAAVFEWLDGVSLGSVFSEGDLDALLETLLAPDLTTTVLAAHAAACEDGTPIGELVRHEDFSRFAATVAGMNDMQGAILDQITTSEVYAELISHVLFQGIRNYVTTESPIARVPGASSLMRMGQNAFDTAAPKLSKGIEKQLTSFVSANLQETLRESRLYLESVTENVDIDEIADDIYTRNADTALNEIAELVPQEALAEMVSVGQDALAHLLDTPTLRAAAQYVLDANAARPVGEILSEVGVTVESVVAFVRPWVLRAADDGLAEELIRERLTAFYLNYEAP